MFFAVLIGVLITLYFGSRIGAGYRTPLTGCVRDDGTGGASGVFRWAQRLGFRVRRSEIPVVEAAQFFSQPAGNCILTTGNGSWSPMNEEIDEMSGRKLRDWLIRGNTLIVVTTDLESLPDALLIDYSLTEPSESAAVAGMLFDGGSVEPRPKTNRARVKSGGSLTVESNGPRLNETEKRPPAAETFPKALAAFKKSMDSRKKSKYKSAEKKATPDRKQVKISPEVIASDERGDVLVRLPAGAGSIYILLDDYAWTNAGFDQGESARVLAEILRSELRGGEVAFDEYRHGHGRAESFLTYLLYLPGSSALMGLMAVWSLLYVYGRNVRLRSVDEYVETERRTAQEYIDAVAQLYERARAAPLVVEAAARRLRQLSRSSADPIPAVAAALSRADLLVKAEDRPADPQAAMKLVRELIQIRKQFYGSRTIS